FFYPLSLHDALPIYLVVLHRHRADLDGDPLDDDGRPWCARSDRHEPPVVVQAVVLAAEHEDVELEVGRPVDLRLRHHDHPRLLRSEEHTSELQSLAY